MDMLNKLKSTVSTMVSQLSGVLPGNPVTREYEVGKQIGSAGPELLWKIYAGHKKSTRQEAAVFVLEKKLLDKYPKKDKDQIIDVLRKGVAQLTRLRHPQILTVQHSLEESRESLAFATEPVFASLANVLGIHENLPAPPPAPLSDYRLFDVEIKHGLQQLSEGLIFLHNDVKLLHGNLCPESIIVNQQGAWKVFGFDFCSTGQSVAEGDGGGKWQVRQPDPELAPAAQPNLDFLAPELGATVKRQGGNVNLVTCAASADLYSLGCLMAAIYQGGQSPWRMDGDVECFFRHAKSQPFLAKVGGIPAELVEHVRSLVQASPELRPDAHQLIRSAWFDDVGVKTLNYLDSLFQWDNLQKSQFYKGLPQVLANLPHRVCLHRIMPLLAKEFINPSMVPFVLPCALLIAADATKEHYVQYILPYLKPVMKIQDPVQVLLIFMQKMELLLQKTPADDVKSDVLPMVLRALDPESSAQIQELCLARVPDFAALVDYPAMKNALLPRIKRLCQGTQQLSVRVNCLLCIGKLLDHVDKWLVLDDILPLLPVIPSKDPAVIMGILGIYKVAMEHTRLGIPKEVLATQILPFLFPLTVEPSLSLTQFRTLMQIIQDMTQRVDDEVKTKLTNVQAMQDQHRSSLSLMTTSSTTTPPSASSAVRDVSNNSSSGQKSINAAPARASNSAATPSFSQAPSSSFSLSDKTSSIDSTNGQSTALSGTVWPPTPTVRPSGDAVSSMMRSNLSSMAGPTPSNNLFKSPLVSQMPVMSQTSIMSPTSMMSQSPLISQSPMMPQSTMMSQSTMISQSPMMPQSMMMSQTPTLQPWSSNGFASQPSWNKSSTFHFEQMSLGGGAAPLIASPATTVRPLARADIDDLLS